MIDLNGLSRRSLEIAEKRMRNGANIKTDTLGMLKHCAGEVVEATEAYTNIRYAMLPNYDDANEQFVSELADIICCALIIAGREEIDIEEALRECVERNRKRAEKQGDKL